MNEKIKSVTQALCIDDFKSCSSKLLAKEIVDFINGGSRYENTLRRNQKIYEKFLLLPKVLAGIIDCDLQIKLLKQNYASPMMVAPMALNHLCHPKGEIVIAKFCAQQKINYVVSCMSSSSLEEIANVGGAYLWFQLYPFKQWEITLDLLRRAEKSGYQAIVITVDMPVMAIRNRDVSNKLNIDLKTSYGNLKNYFQDVKTNTDTKTFVGEIFKTNFSWDDIGKIREHTSLPIILKGILHPEDAKISLQHQVDSIIISNHGGRQLDSTVTAIEVLPEIAKIINKKIPLIIDGGIHTGKSVFLSIAMGASAVLVGRPFLWALASNGHDGVNKMYSIIENELKEIMLLCGFPNMGAVGGYGLNHILADQSY